MTGKWCCGACARGGHVVGYWDKSSLQENHLAKNHVKCSCGWVGVSFGSHRHYQVEPNDHQPVVDKFFPDMEKDAKPPGWMGP